MSTIFPRTARPLAAAAVLVLVACVLAPAPARACSICRCGDPAFAALGPDVFGAHAWRVALDGDRFDKENAVSDPDGTVVGHDAEVEERLTLTAAYTWNETVSVVARVPYSRRRLVETDFEEGAAESTRTSGLSDPEVQVHVRVWASPLTGLGRRSWVSLVAGVKTPWGRNDLARDGARLDEHAQPGTGSTDLVAGAAAVHVLGLRDTLLASVQARRTGTNDAGYRYGNVLLANLGWEHKFGPRLDGVVELNWRHAARDVVDEGGTEDANTGGSLLYVQPRLSVTLGAGFVARVAALVPVAQRLNGDQTERTIWSAGITRVF